MLAVALGTGASKSVGTEEDETTEPMAVAGLPLSPGNASARWVSAVNWKLVQQCITDQPTGPRWPTSARPRSPLHLGVALETRRH